MDPISLVIAAVTSLAAFGASRVIKKLVRPITGTDDIVVVTSDGRKTTIKASELNAAKVAEIAGPQSAVSSAAR